MKVTTFTCDVVGCCAQADTMDSIEIPGSKGVFQRNVCNDHLQKLWVMFGCVVPGQR